MRVTRSPLTPMDGVVPIISVSLQVSKPVGSTFHVVLQNQTEDSVFGRSSILPEGTCSARCNQCDGHAPTHGGFYDAEILKETMGMVWLRLGICEARGPSGMCVSFSTAVWFGTYFLFVRHPRGAGELEVDLSRWSQ